MPEPHAENGKCPGPTPLVVASYNIHGAVGTDGRFDPARIAAVIDELEADVVGLQELDTRRLPVGMAPWLEALAARTGLHAVVGPTVEARDGYYGNALLSRHPVTRRARHDISVRGREPRGVLDVHLDAGVPVRVLVTHFGLRRRERRRQAQVVVEHVGDPGDAVDVLLADFNEWMPFGGTLVRLARAFGAMPQRRTWPSRWPVLPLDRVMVRPRDALREVTVHRSPRARVASDHLPIRAVLALPG